MNRILIVGSDSITGREVASRLSSTSRVEALWLKAREFPDGCTSGAVDAFDFTEASDVDVVVFCGGAAKSSWQSDFGNFSAEKKWLKTCVKFANKSNAKLVYLSSDAVFGGPWVFHNDDDQTYCDSSKAQAILKWETVAAAADTHLIVRSNVLGTGDDGFIDGVVDSLRDNQTFHIATQAFSTILSDVDFAKSLTCCLKNGVTGYVNIGGGERTTPFTFVSLLASQLNSTSVVAVDPKFSPLEQSLRCDRLRAESDATIPLLKDTIQVIIAQINERSQFATAA